MTYKITWKDRLRAAAFTIKIFIGLAYIALMGWFISRDNVMGLVMAAIFLIISLVGLTKTQIEIYHIKLNEIKRQKQADEDTYGDGLGI